MDKTEFLGKLQLCYFGDKNAFEEIVGVYDDLQQQIEKAIEYIEYQLSLLDAFKDEDIKAKMLGAMVLVILKGDDTNE